MWTNDSEHIPNKKHICTLVNSKHVEGLWYADVVDMGLNNVLAYLSTLGEALSGVRIQCWNIAGISWDARVDASGVPAAAKAANSAE